MLPPSQWSEVVVCITVDGRRNANPTMLEFLQFDAKLFDPSLLRE